MICTIELRLYLSEHIASEAENQSFESSLQVSENHSRAMFEPLGIKYYSQYFEKAATLVENLMVHSLNLSTTSC